MFDFNKKKKGKKQRKTRRSHIHGRYLFLTFSMLFVAALCVLMLFKTTVVDADKWTAKGDSTFIDTITIPPMRGDILASDGSLLATNLYYYTVRLDFQASKFNELKYFNSVDSLADTLARYYPKRTRDEWRAYLRYPIDSVAKKKDRTHCYTLLQNITYDELERLRQFPHFRRSRNPNVTGLSIDRRLRRMYPYGTMASLSIGRVGETAESSEKHGISGLEQALDSILYGKPGLAKKTVVTRGTTNWPITAPVDGPAITTTIDVTIQDLLEHELGEMLLTCKAKWGSAMIMEVSTGDIKAISNLDYDTIHGTYIESRNHIVEAYEPGSVIKVISMLTALEDGYVDLNRTYPIEPKGVGYHYAGGKAIQDTHSPSYLPVSRFIEYSSNIGMTKLIAPHYENDLNGLRERLRQIGFFDRFNTGMARERVPYYPTLDPKRGGRVSLSRMIFGYATLVPPLYTCAIYNAIANDGRFVRPRLVKALHYADGRDSIIPVSYVRDRICSVENAQILRKMMHEVVWGEAGTAKGLRNDLVEIAGKTGTAGIAKEAPRDKDGKLIKTATPFKGGYVEGRHNRVAFCGFFPYESPKYTCIVVVSDPQGPIGPATTAGTVLRNLALKLYSRGMLGNSSDYAENPISGTRPTFYGTHNPERTSLLRTDLQTDRYSLITTAPAGSKSNKSVVPDVRGLGIREALVQLETAGLLVRFSGTGYVTAIDPAPGTPVAPRTKINVTLSQN